MALASKLRTRALSLGKATPSLSNSRRNAPRASVVALFSVIGLYTLGFVVWSMYLSNSFGVMSSSGNVVDVRLSPQLMQQLRRRQKTMKTNAKEDVAAGKRWMEQLLKSGNKPPDLRCIGWKQTDTCNPQTLESPLRNRGCDHFVPGGFGGYCLMEDEDTGQQIKLIHTACSTLHPSVMLSCRHANDFVDFRWEVMKLAATIERENEVASDKEGLTTTLAPPVSRSQGILMVIYPAQLVSAYASIRALRAVNCSLPVELWYIESEMDIGNGTSLLDDVPTKLQQEYGPLTLHPITDSRVAGFSSKVYAITHTQFEHVLYLDADNVPVKDPSYLFKSQEFLQTGAIFWPDFWHPDNTIFNINENSLLWELLDMPYTDMFEQESGQLVIDKTRSSAALRMLFLFAFHDPNVISRYKLAHGDKDLFRLAWLKTKTPFHMVSNPPGIAGTMRKSKFCGMSMVQFDTDGEVLFLHRNSKKLTGGIGANRKPDEQIWTHLQYFLHRAATLQGPDTKEAIEVQRVSAMPYDLLRQKYLVHIYNGAPEFDATQWCYGHSTPRFKTVAWQDTMFPEVEKRLMRYANEAVALLPESAVKHIMQSD